MTSRDMPTGSVTDELRSDILDGRFEPGDRLLEVPLSQHYACGRAAVRSALVELTTEGLVEREANRGATVRRISITEAIQITEARAALEGLIAAHAARNATDDERTELREIIDDMRLAVGDDRARDYSGLNARFHRRLREMSGHTVAARAGRQPAQPCVAPSVPARADAGPPERVTRTARRDRRRRVAGDESAAAAAMDAHLRSVIDVLSRWGDVATAP